MIELTPTLHLDQSEHDKEICRDICELNIIESDNTIPSLKVDVQKIPQNLPQVKYSLYKIS